MEIYISNDLCYQFNLFYFWKLVNRFRNNKSSISWVLNVTKNDVLTHFEHFTQALSQ